ncbi:hypothetical protein GGI11_000099 [Coemansia sp. RSA 2049]|nr:hypothetical protein GGI11_000099 [Coemansia sp. RSA 2049]
MGAAGRAYRWTKQQVHCFLFHSPVLQNEALFTTSWIFPQPAVFAARAVVFAYCLGVLVTNLVVNIVHGAGWNWAAYFTTLTYVGIAMYFGLAAYNTAAAWMRPPADADSIPTQQEQTETEAEGVVRIGGLDNDGASVRADGTGMLLLPGTPPAPSAPTGDAIEEEEGENAPDSVRIARSRTNRSSRSKRTMHSSIVYVDHEAALAESGSGPGSAGIADQGEGEREDTARKVLLASQWLLYESFTCFAPLVTIVYWALLYPTSDGFAAVADVWMGVSMHAVNTVLMAAEVLLLARIPFNLMHLSVPLTFMTLYLGLVYFMVAVYGFYVYPFFEARYFGGYIAIVCLLVVNIVAIIWVALVLLHYWRDRAYPRWAAAFRMRRLEQALDPVQDPPPAHELPQSEEPEKELEMERDLDLGLPSQV